MPRFLFRVTLAALIAITDLLASRAQTPGAPMALPAPFVTATNLLFDDGLADPRGGEYRAIKIHVGNIWGGEGGMITTDAWVLPTPGSDGAKRAVAWNGLLYTVVADVGAAKLAADVEAIGTTPSTRPDHLVYIDRNSEAYSVDIHSRFSVKASLLLRLGETALAERAYTAIFHTAPQSGNPAPSYDPFVQMAGDWAWTAFERAVCAHMRGDDQLARADATLLSKAGLNLEAQATSHAPTSPTSPISPDGKPAVYFGFLQPVPELLADSRRRLSRPELPLDLSHVKATHPKQNERIAFLLAHLDDVAERQSGQPGGVNLADGPISKAIIVEGEAAVDPLLDVMKKDTRLTRSVRFGRDFFRERELLTVRDAAIACAVQILHTSVFDSDRFNHDLSVGEIEAYWNANRGIPLPERWYRTLADDSAAPRQWMEAASHIVQPVSVDRRVRQGVSWNDKSEGTPPMQGASLRIGKNPSVSALFERRINEMSVNGHFPAGPNAVYLENFGYADGINLGLMYAAWDAKASLPTLKMLVSRMQQVGEDRVTNHDANYSGQLIAQLTLTRLRAGDIEAAHDYVDFLHTVQPSQYTRSFSATLSPLSAYPDDPALAAVAEELFNGPHADWNPIVPPADTARRNALSCAELVGSPLLCVPAFRRQVLRELDDKRALGVATVKARNQVELKLNGEGGGYGDIANEPYASPIGTPFPVRMCDMYAWKISKIATQPQIDSSGFGVPHFEIYWPESKRDEAIVTIKTYLSSYGNDFVPTRVNAPFYTSYPSVGLTLQLPPLDHPAAAEDVHAGHAIFTLGDSGARVVKLTHPFPIAARWRKNPVINRTVQTYSEKTGSKIVDLPDYAGTVYQAEEVREGGTWHRYYGFVGQHTMARVPAEEIELLGADGKKIE